MLESLTRIAYAAVVPSSEPIRPLHDVWLRPRRVFRALADRPVEAVEYLLAAGQGIAGFLFWSRAQNAGATSGVAEIFGRALLLGSVGGIAGLFFMGSIYTRLGSRAGTAAARRDVVHVLAYSGVPLSASLVVWLLTALLAGEATFEQTPRSDVEGFVALVLLFQVAVYVLCALWSVVIQVMGFSEIQGVATRRAFGLWVLGQVIGCLAMLFVVIVIATLLPPAPG
jgi:Yip1 domain